MKSCFNEADNESNIKQIIDGHGMVFFFKKDDDFFGVGEEGRISFARIKNPDNESPDGWEDDASFTAFNISKMVNGEVSQSVFDKDSIKNIKVVDRDDVISELKDSAKETGVSKDCIKIIRFGIMPTDKDRDETPNLTQKDEQ